ncbi:glycosyltransferase family 2 protein [Pedobacter sp. AW31-3R]|uniref:glycosyltransferase family 2 protein n=1 Tax=Pedobacter sp. AW31-3R TaxID=3445781 RepID=UPI003FA07C68
MTSPLVTCIMPTADRPKFMVQAISNFFAQDYPRTELIIIDDSSRSYAQLIPPTPQIRYYYLRPLGTIGCKRNFACKQAKGEIIAHWDDDDTYAYDWISRSVNQLIICGADIIGLRNIVFHSVTSNSHFLYRNNHQDPRWLCGATLIYKKSIWSAFPFSNLQIGEDTDFLFNCGGKIAISNYTDGFVANIHNNNTSIKFLRSELIEGK